MTPRPLHRPRRPNWPGIVAVAAGLALFGGSAWLVTATVRMIGGPEQVVAMETRR